MNRNGASKKESNSQKIGRLGEIEFEYIFRKLDLSIDIQGIFGQERREAYLRLIKNHQENDFGFDYSAEVFWVIGDDGEPSGLSLYFQLKSWKRNPSFKKEDIDYFIRQSIWHPVVIVWKVGDNYRLLNFREWYLKNQERVYANNGRQSIPKNDWFSFNIGNKHEAEEWFREILQDRYNRMLSSSLVGIDRTIAISEGIVRGIISLSGHEIIRIQHGIYKISKKDKKSLYLGFAQQPEDAVLVPDPTKGDKLFGAKRGQTRGEIIDIFFKIDSDFDKALIISFDTINMHETGRYKESGIDIFDINVSSLNRNPNDFFQKVLRFLEET